MQSLVRISTCTHTHTHLPTHASGFLSPPTSPCHIWQMLHHFTQFWLVHICRGSLNGWFDLLQSPSPLCITSYSKIPSLTTTTIMSSSPSSYFFSHWSLPPLTHTHSPTFYSFIWLLFLLQLFLLADRPYMDKNEKKDERKDGCLETANSIHWLGSENPPPRPPPHFLFIFLLFLYSHICLLVLLLLLLVTNDNSITNITTIIFIISSSVSRFSSVWLQKKRNMACSIQNGISCI